MLSGSHILLFDGYCNLCNGLVRFVMKRDTDKIILFLALSSEKGKYLLEKAGLDPANTDSVVFFSDGKCFLKSMAILKLFRVMGGGWKLFYAFVVIPRFIRDSIYNIIARNRQRIFGRSETCMIPDTGTDSRSGRLQN